MLVARSSTDPFITSDDALYHQQLQAATEGTCNNFDDKDYDTEQQSILSRAGVNSSQHQPPHLDNFARVVNRRDEKHDIEQVQRILEQTEQVKQQLMNSSSKRSLHQSRLNSVRNSATSSKPLGAEE